MKQFRRHRMNESRRDTTIAPPQSFSLGPGFRPWRFPPPSRFDVPSTTSSPDSLFKAMLSSPTRPSELKVSPTSPPHLLEFPSVLRPDHIVQASQVALPSPPPTVHSATTSSGDEDLSTDQGIEIISPTPQRPTQLGDLDALEILAKAAESCRKADSAKVVQSLVARDCLNRRRWKRSSPYITSATRVSLGA